MQASKLDKTGGWKKFLLLSVILWVLALGLAGLVHAIVEGAGGVLTGLLVVVASLHAFLVLAFILEPLIEHNFIKTLIIHQGNYGVFFTRPLAALILACTLVFTIIGFWREKRIAKKDDQPGGEDPANG